MAEISWHGLLEMVRECVAEWNPERHAKEVDYSRSLAQFLRRSLPEHVHVECEYRHCGGTIDIYIQCAGLDAHPQRGELIFEDEVFLELKLRLNRKPELDRLVGQIAILNPTRNKAIVVLIGQCDDDLVSRLRRQFRPQLAQGFGVNAAPTMAVVEVPEAP